MADLFHATQAVLQVYAEHNACGVDGVADSERKMIAAALRAAVDQAAPEEAYCSEDDSFCEYLRRTQRQETRGSLYAIATELENH